MDDYTSDVQHIQASVHGFAADLNRQIREFRQKTGIPIMIYVTEPSQQSLGSHSTQEILVRAII